MRTAVAQLTTYARRFQTRLAGKNRVYLTQTIRLVASLAGYLERVAAGTEREGEVRQADLMAGRGVDQINPHKLLRYLDESKLARKVDGYAQAHSSDETRSAVPVLFQLQAFLLPLMNPSGEGKLFFERSDRDALLKYALLDPTEHFRDIVEEARAVVLAGGTMSPVCCLLLLLYGHHSLTELHR